MRSSARWRTVGSRSRERSGLASQRRAADTGSDGDGACDPSDDVPTSSNERAASAKPGVLVVDHDGVVVFADVHTDYTTRTEVDEIVAALDLLEARAA